MTSCSHTVAGIPVVDFSNADCLKPGTSSWLSARKDVCRALEELGCFMAILPSKVLPGLHKTIFGAYDELFNFPVDTPEKPFRAGYVTSSSGQKGIGIMNGTNPNETQEFTLHFWPDGNDQFRESADLYARVMAEIDQAVTRMVFENYGVEKYYDDHFQSTSYILRFLKYKEPKKLEVDVGLRSHTDKNFSTILHQNHVNGLEINTKNDEWVVFDPLPSSVIFIAGDALQIWSNDRIRSCRHKVTLRENEVRYSFVLLSINKGVIQVPDELVDKEHPLRYKPLNHLEFLRAQKDAGETEETLDKYAVELQEVTKYLWKLICENLGLNSEKLASMCEDGTQGLRMNYYPPCPQASRVMGLIPHSDAVGLTLLIQVNDVQGLQIKNNGRWILSNGEYKSIEHRAVVNTERERLSIAGFHSPNTMTMIGPLPDLVKEKAANYKAISNEEYIRLVTSKLDGKNLLDHMKLKQ
ncbi:hypothetical protein ACE6H2_016628 [Prunus campanulata]